VPNRRPERRVGTRLGQAVLLQHKFAGASSRSSWRVHRCCHPTTRRLDLDLTSSAYVRSIAAAALLRSRSKKTSRFNVEDFRLHLACRCSFKVRSSGRNEAMLEPCAQTAMGARLARDAKGSARNPRRKSEKAGARPWPSTPTAWRDLPALFARAGARCTRRPLVGHGPTAACPPRARAILARVPRNDVRFPLDVRSERDGARRVAHLVAVASPSEVPPRGRCDRLSRCDSPTPSVLRAQPAARQVLVVFGRSVRP